MLLSRVAAPVGSRIQATPAVTASVLNQPDLTVS